VVLEFAFPPVCLGCRRLLRAAVPAGSPPLCRRCAPELGHLAPEARRVGDIEALFLYEGPLAGAVVRLKFGNQLDLAGPLGRVLAAAPVWREGWDLVAPAPLHWRRAWLRGYNQAALLARWAVRARATVPAAPGPAAAVGPGAAEPPPRLEPGLLRRVRATAPQTDLDRAARSDNLAGAIAVGARPVAGRRVLVIDDVTTTGATLGACLDALRAAGAARAAGLALLRAAL
jgi:predicted amidophosphoribosyltransferase